MANSNAVFDITPQGGDAPEHEDPGVGGLGRADAPNSFTFGEAFSFGGSPAPAPELNLTGLSAGSGTAFMFDLDTGSLPKSAQTGGGASHNLNAEFSMNFDFQQPEQPRLQVPAPGSACCCIILQQSPDTLCWGPGASAAERTCAWPFTRYPFGERLGPCAAAERAREGARLGACCRGDQRQDWCYTCLRCRQGSHRRLTRKV